MNNTMEITNNRVNVSFKKNIYLIIKRIFDIFVGLIGTILLIPISIIIKIIYLFNKDYHSIFYKQVRIGKNGKKFNLYKYRSMVKDADEILERTLSDSKELRLEWLQNQKLENDPRITKIGKILRKTSIDEIPQFINLLKGDMSLIGPRPLIKGELKSHNGDPEIYESVRPGITGWWGCNGRSDTNYKERLKLEYFYVNNMSLKLDLKVIFKTIKTIIIREGAK